MSTDAQTVPAGTRLRRLARDDLDQVVQIDASIAGRPRRGYFERRLQAALREPLLHLQFAVERDGRLEAYALARRLEGEFGRPDPALRLEVIGVPPDLQGRGLGSTLLRALEAEAERQGIRELRTQAPWNDHGMLGFLDRAGFELGTSHVIDCEVRAGRLATDAGERAPGPGRPGSAAEIDFGAPTADFETLARDRADVRSLRSEDVEGAARIDRRITGLDRSAYIARQVAEALLDSAIRVSLAAHRDGSLAGYLAASMDFGDFGRAEPAAVIDTIGVDPGFAGAGIGTALLSQLFVNLQALHVERVETVIARERLDLLGFFYGRGFVPSRRLGFVKHLDRGATS
jgi:ribosomal protein S18 acetylase RimI-like enzyme